MNQNNRPSIIYWGKKLINLSIFFQKIEFLKLAEKLVKYHKNLILKDILTQYSVLMPRVLSY